MKAGRKSLVGLSIDCDNKKTTANLKIRGETVQSLKLRLTGEDEPPMRRVCHVMEASQRSQWTALGTTNELCPRNTAAAGNRGSKSKAGSLFVANASPCPSNMLRTRHLLSAVLFDLLREKDCPSEPTSKEDHTVMEMNHRCVETIQ